MRRKFVIFGLILSLILLPGCQSKSDTENGNFRVTTSFYPLYIMAMNLTDGVEGVKLANMAEPSTGCLHDYQLRPKDVISLDGADLFLINGAGMESFLEDVMASYPDLKVYEAVDALEEEDFIEEEDEHEHEDEHEEEEEHEHNPHTWLDPALYRKEIAYFCQVLKENDPAHADQYEANYQEYDAKIQELQESFQWEDKGESAVILHESFPYLLRTCQISLAASADVEKDSGFSAHEIVELVDTAEEAAGGYILSDNQYSGRISELLAEETGMKVMKLDSCVSGEYDKDAYINAMRKNFQIISGGGEDEN